MQYAPWEPWPSQVQRASIDGRVARALPNPRLPRGRFAARDELQRVQQQLPRPQRPSSHRPFIRSPCSEHRPRAVDVSAPLHPNGVRHRAFCSRTFQWWCICSRTKPSSAGCGSRFQLYDVTDNHGSVLIVVQLTAEQCDVTAQRQMHAGQVHTTCVCSHHAAGVIIR